MIQFLAILSLIFVSAKAWSYPEMIRHGYLNCTACHVSPSGGGMMTPYGRGLSREVLSTWGTENETRFLHGVNTESIEHYLNLGGQAKSVQTHREDKLEKVGKFIRMQLGLEAAVNFKGSQFVAFIGTWNHSDPDKPEWYPWSWRHFLVLPFNDEVTIRVGRFQPTFGLNIPQHIVSTRAGFFPSQNEMPMLELSIQKENWNAFLNAGRDDATKSNDEALVSTSANFLLGEKSKWGGGILRGKGRDSNRTMYSLHTILSLTDTVYLMGEELLRKTEMISTKNTTESRARFLKLGYEPFQGLHGLLWFDMNTNDISKPNNTRTRYGPGFAWYPRPHFEIEGAWWKEKADSKAELSDYAWLMLHYYF